MSDSDETGALLPFVGASRSASLIRSTDPIDKETAMALQMTLVSSIVASIASAIEAVKQSGAKLD